MSSYRQRLRQEIGSVLKSRDVKNLKLSLLNAVFEPMKTHVDGFRHFRGEDVIGQTHRALIGVGGWGCPMLWRIRRSSSAILAAAKIPAYSASATKEQTTGMRVECTDMGWL